jgi:hypothetical protein
MTSCWLVNCYWCFGGSCCLCTQGSPRRVDFSIDLRLLFIFNVRTAAFKAYCAIWVRRSNFRHQASPRLSPCESTQWRKVELRARNVREFCLKFDFHVTFRDLLHAVKLRHETDGFTSPPKEGVLRISFALKIWRLRPGANPRTWVPKASTLPLDHRSHYLRLQ